MEKRKFLVMPTPCKTRHNFRMKSHTNFLLEKIWGRLQIENGESNLQYRFEVKVARPHTAKVISFESRKVKFQGEEIQMGVAIPKLDGEPHAVTAIGEVISVLCK